MQYITSFAGAALLNINTLLNVTVILAPNASSPILLTITGISNDATTPDTMLVAFGTTLPSLSLQNSVNQST